MGPGSVEAVSIPGSAGNALAGRLEAGGAGAHGVVFAHCFTCGKESRAATGISRALARAGFSVLRYDMPGVGQSDGAFADSRFTTRVDSVVDAADWLRARGHPPSLLVGHSLGGATVIAAAERVPDALGVATIGAPVDPAHVGGLISAALGDRDEAVVRIGSREFGVSRDLLEDLAEQPQLRRLARLGRALLVLHSPVDTVVGIEHATEIFTAARHPKSFISLDDADHLLTSRADAEYVAALIAAWATRYLNAQTDLANQPAERPSA